MTNQCFIFQHEFSLIKAEKSLDTRNNIIKNNLFIANAQSLLISNAYTQNVNNVIDNNLYFAGETAAASEWQWKNTHYQGFSSYQSATGNDENSTFNDPLILQIESKNFHLSSASPAIDSGDNSADIGALDHDNVTRIVGSNVDQGALEFGNTPPLSYNLPSNQWKQFSLPCNPGSSATIGQLLADDIPGTYGSDWIMYSYTPGDGYINPGLDGILKQGVGYWIIQANTSTATIKMSAGCLAPPLSISSQCLSARGCFEASVATTTTANQWNMIGHPLVRSEAWNNLVIATVNGVCADSDGCTLTEATDANIFHHQGFRYNSVTNSYDILGETGNLTAFDGLWVATLTATGANYPRLLFPDTTVLLSPLPLQVLH